MNINSNLRSLIYIIKFNFFQHGSLGIHFHFIFTLSSIWRLSGPTAKGQYPKVDLIPQPLPESGSTDSGSQHSVVSTLLNIAATVTGTGNAGISSSAPPFPTINNTSSIAAGSGFLTTTTDQASIPGISAVTSTYTSALNSPVPVSGTWSITATEPTVALPSYDSPSGTIAGPAATSEAVQLSGYVPAAEITLVRLRIEMLNPKLSADYFLRSMQTETISPTPNSSNSTSTT